MDFQNATDPELTDLIKEKDNEDALNLLIERHSGIYVDIVKKYGSQSLPNTDIYDIISDKDYVIYKAALDYDENKAKFSTHVGNKAKYLCFSLFLIYSKNDKLTFLYIVASSNKNFSVM